MRGEFSSENDRNHWRHLTRNLDVYLLVPVACLLYSTRGRRALTKHRTIFEAIVNQSGSGEPAFSPAGLDDTPVDYWPGSPEKINVIARRLDAGLELWHPQDRHCLDKYTHRQMFRDLVRDVEMGDERERTVWVSLDAVIVMLTDAMVTVRKRRVNKTGYKQIRLQRDHVARYRYVDIGERLEPLNGVPLVGLLIPRWLAEARNLVEI